MRILFRVAGGRRARVFEDPEEKEIAVILVYLDVDLLAKMDRDRSSWLSEVLTVVFEIGDVGAHQASHASDSR